MAREKDGTFAKGSSGNPGGRPKAPVKFRELYDNDDCDELIYARLRYWMDQDEDAKVSIAAMDRLLERRYGRVTPAVDADGPADAISSTDAEVAQAMRDQFGGEAQKYEDDRADLDGLRK